MSTVTQHSDTPTIGRYLGLPIPQGCTLSLGVWPSTGEQFEELVDEAARHGLITAGRESNGSRWIDLIGHTPGVGMTVYCPLGFMVSGSDAESFEEFIDRKMKSLKFIEIAAPDEELSVQDRMDRVGVVS